MKYIHIWTTWLWEPESRNKETWVDTIRYASQSLFVQIAFHFPTQSCGAWSPSYEIQVTTTWTTMIPQVARHRVFPFRNYSMEKCCLETRVSWAISKHMNSYFLACQRNQYFEQCPFFNTFCILCKQHSFHSRLTSATSMGSSSSCWTMRLAPWKGLERCQMHQTLPPFHHSEEWRMYLFLCLGRFGSFFCGWVSSPISFHIVVSYFPNTFPLPAKNNENIKAPAVLLDLGVSDEVEIWAAEKANVWHVERSTKRITSSKEV